MPSPSPRPASVTPAGYSGTPLAKKLGYKPGSCALLMGAPAEYRGWLEPLPAGVRFEKKAGPGLTLVHLFTTERSEMRKALTSLRKSLAVDAAIWVSWPKKSSRVATDITEDTIREVALPLGFVDIKVCAVSDVWSGLKLVVRQELR